MKEFLNDLNERQREAVMYNEGASLVVAGAGSGKTRVLTYKIACLLKQGLPPYSILALTFTNKAAREMKERIGTLIDPQTARRLWAGTFHSVFARILRSQAEAVGFTRNFTIYDSADSKSLLRAIIKEMLLDEKQYKPSAVQSRISTAKNQLVTPESYRSNADLLHADVRSKMPMIKDIYERYFHRCKQSDAMDFDDLLLYTNLLFKQQPDILANYQRFFQFILVDEYQDTNFAQHRIIQQLAEQHRRVCVVGDDAQSIYSFRGANIENILQFQHQYPECRLFKLEQNYRSTQTIVNAANSLIDKNKNRIPKTVFSERAQGAPIEVVSTLSDIEEAFAVVSRIVSMHERQRCAYSDFVVLYRTNAQSRVFEESLRKRGVPYKIYGGLSFYQRKEIKDTIAYFRLSLNPNDNEAFKRIVNYPARGIGDTTASKVEAIAQAQGAAMLSIASDPLGFNLNVNAGTAKKLTAFAELIAECREAMETTDAYHAADRIVKASGISEEIYKDKTPENLSRQENVEELLSAIYQFVESRREEDEEAIGLADFLAEVSLLTDQDTETAEDRDKVSLMTVHASKGLEFKNVFVAGMEEELFPSARCSNSQEELEEERRLFYVAITRAEENCTVSHAASRFRNGQTNFSNPSRFIGDIDGRWLKSDKIFQPPRPPKGGVGAFADDSANHKFLSEKGNGGWRKLTPLTTFPSDNYRNSSQTNGSANHQLPPSGGGGALTVGSRIRHERFGEGTVKRLEGEGENRKMWVDFGNNEQRQLLLKFAKFVIIE